MTVDDGPTEADVLDPDGGGPGAAQLCHTGQVVADYVWRPDLPGDVAPRPYLHPVRTLGGTEVTELMPADHRHHLGVSIAVPDLAGCNFWGGRTFVRAQGPTHLDNHGTQRHLSWVSRSAEAVTVSLSWESPDGVELLRERRRMSTMPVGEEGWALDFAFELTNVTAQPLAFASPATNGRPGAGYGGFFWRAPRTGRRVAAFGAGNGGGAGNGRGAGNGKGVGNGKGNGRVAGGSAGERGLHGRPNRWLALTGTGSDRKPWSLVFIPADSRTGEDPWFVRTRDYPGIGSSLAWDRPLLLDAGGVVRRRIITVVVDGVLPAARAAGLAEEAARYVRDEAGGTGKKAANHDVHLDRWGAPGTRLRGSG